MSDEIRQDTKGDNLFGAVTSVTQFIRTGLDGSAKLEVVLHFPPGDGPFPLAVMNHGSTGDGKNPAFFGETWSFTPLADFLTRRGWMVAFPQRRGRGKSDGSYDEGFCDDRTKGYACGDSKEEIELSLRGADRALQDIEAAIATLRQHPLVTPSRILIGGVSRGGALSVAYAGEHPEQIHGVLNFVGGWVDDDCTYSADINRQVLVRGGAPFDRPMLWLYGRRDMFYSMPHIRSHFESFKAAGGRGTLKVFEPQGKFGNSPLDSGHSLMRFPELWSTDVNLYLDELEKLRSP